jgi:hypothetical protein
VAEERIEHLGEPLDALRQDYEVLDRFRALKSVRHDLAQ